MDDVTGRIKTFDRENKFQTDMLHALFSGGLKNFIWCFAQFLPCTCGLTQYFLRRKVLNGDMSQYQCCQGYVNICGIGAGSFGEDRCPHFCLCAEACLCNGFSVSASRMLVMDRYQLSSDPCDYRLVRINNAIQMLACVCDILAMVDRNLRGLSRLLDFLADIFYHAVSGCMTAQVAHEMNYQTGCRIGTKQPLLQIAEPIE
jgi:hypothetical protein